MASKPTLDVDVLDLLDALDAAKAEYVVIGAHALGAHGIIRATADFDVLVRPTLVNAQRVYSALIEFGAPLAAHGVQAAYFSKAGRVYQIGLPPKRIDLLTSISGVEVNEAFDSAVRVSVGKKLRRVLGIGALIKNKSATGRPKDKLDVRSLRALMEKSLKRQTRKRKAPG